jgi:hypothetical protein
MATKFEKRRHDDGTFDVSIAGWQPIKARDEAEADALMRVAHITYRAGRKDEAAIRASAFAGLMQGNPLA